VIVLNGKKKEKKNKEQFRAVASVLNRTKGKRKIPCCSNHSQHQKRKKKKAVL